MSSGQEKRASAAYIKIKGYYLREKRTRKYILASSFRVKKASFEDISVLRVWIWEEWFTRGRSGWASELGTVGLRTGGVPRGAKGFILMIITVQPGQFTWWRGKVKALRQSSKAEWKKIDLGS